MTNKKINFVKWDQLKKQIDEENQDYQYFKRYDQDNLKKELQAIKHNFEIDNCTKL